MRINVSIAAGLVCGIAFARQGGGFQTEFGASVAGRFRHKLLRKTVRGTLLADAGVEFFHEPWAQVDLHGFELSAKEPTLNSYQNLPWHEPARHP